MSEFSPPVAEYTITSFGELPSGEAEAITLMLRDANNRLFSLHVEAADARQAPDSEDDPEETEKEPVFVVPGATVDTEVIEEILDLAPRLLRRYLVSQDEPGDKS